MTRILKLSAAVVALSLLAACATDKMMSDKKMKSEMAGPKARAHIGHVVTAWKDTPGGKGLLTTAEGEAKVVLQHAGFALQKPNDLKWMKTHTEHVAHAVDPSSAAKGPGLGYGLIKAADGAAKHIEFAAASPDASKNVKTHAVHVAASSRNAVDRGKKIMVLVELIRKAKDVFAASAFVREMKNLSEDIVAGIDANDDGKVSWQKGEGGLDTARTHMGFMLKGEGMK